ncbi:PIKK family atypical protein kinase [Histomonas meleagridis]|uniref:PIKK family atypical protein kinase n=1 Tax=Histomonas meleagridis TaxID=135588 RepID=UPI0035596AFC|nr:PIKK family atypical protein kinase [Histomonas meleagridis]KAH0797669.1 PIKK family atypical protein kinase [Histomonas meleagridis]
MGKKHSEISNDAELFVEGMLRSAISWFEEWIVTLDCSSRFYKNEEYDKMDELLEKQFRNYDSPKCDFDRLFIRLYDPIIQQCKAHFRTHKKYSLRKMWDQFKHLFGLLIDRVKKLELILLPKVSEQLATKRNFKISIPGTYSVEHKVPTLYSIEPALQVLSTQQHPRCVYMISSINEKVKFLLKGNEDIRLDQRVMQFFTLINSLLKHNRTTKEVNGMQITKYAIIPLAPNAGLITWVTGADTLHQMINEHRNLYHCSQSIELEIIMDIVGKSNQQLTTLQKLETFNYIKKKCKAYEIREILWLRSKNSFLWIKKNHNFTITTALISMVGYIIGLGDRHPSNIMVQRETGKVIHIDFGDSFEAAILRKVFPEKVPFRLTRMIVNALDNGSVEGIFRKNCEDVMYVLRESKESIVALLEIFVHEPIEEAERFGKEKLQTMIIDRVGEKLNGNDWMLPGYDENNMELNVEEHVDKLIQQAMDPYRYVSHYAGWCPYW